jgi:hypothetical protein
MEEDKPVVAEEKPKRKNRYVKIPKELQKKKGPKKKTTAERAPKKKYEKIPRELWKRPLPKPKPIKDGKRGRPKKELTENYIQEKKEKKKEQQKKYLLKNKEMLKKYKEIAGILK